MDKHVYLFKWASSALESYSYIQINMLDTYKPSNIVEHRVETLLQTFERQLSKSEIGRRHLGKLTNPYTFTKPQGLAYSEI